MSTANIASGMTAAPERAVLVTFDDGFADFSQFALPIAVSEGAKVNLFLCTGLPAAISPQVYRGDSSQMARHRRVFPSLWRGLSWSEVCLLKEGGTDLGFHSHWHDNFGFLSTDKIEHDITEGLAQWRRHLGVLPTAFAFPMGGHGSHPESAVELLREHGFDLLFSTRLGRTRLPTREAILRRIVIHQRDDVETLRRKVFGAYDWLGGLRGLDQAIRSVVMRS